jgi:hexosaminidase
MIKLKLYKSLFWGMVLTTSLYSTSIGAQSNSAISEFNNHVTASNIIPKPIYQRYTGVEIKFNSIEFSPNSPYLNSLKFWLTQFDSSWITLQIDGKIEPMNQPAIASPIQSVNCIKLIIDTAFNGFNYSSSYYEITILNSAIHVKTRTELGAFYAGNTLYQLLKFRSTKQPQPIGDKFGPSIYSLPIGHISDSAILDYRGMHLDVSRHFFGVDFIKTYIDLLALYKFNTFHWHLTDDQGWRIEIKKYPKLHEIGSFRKETMLGKNFQPYKGDQTPHKGYYTQQEIREIVAYAKQRQVEVIPEIEMPGHARAALSAYPQFSCKKLPLEPLTMWGVSEDVFCANDSTFRFLYDILDEIMELFPSKTIHIGGDEVPKTRWKECASCQNTMRIHQLKNEEELQSYFIKKIDQYLTSKGRKIMGWDEILEGGLSPNAQVMSWRGTEGGITAARQQHFVVMTPGSHCYFDHYQGEKNQEPLAIGGYTTLDKVYDFQPIPEELEPSFKKYILGAQANVWTEYMATPEHVSYMVLPRMAALAEVLWNQARTPIEKRNFDDFKARLISAHFPYYQERKWNYSRSIYQIQSEIFRDSNHRINLKLNSHFPEKPIYYLYTPTSQPGDRKPALGEGRTYSTPIVITESCNIQAVVESEETLTPWNKDFQINKASGNTINLRKNPSNRYNIGGSLTLVDGIVGSIPWTSKEWIGFSGDTLDATIQLNGITDKKDSIFVHFLHAPESWIHYPNKISIQVSRDGKKFKTISQRKQSQFSKTEKALGMFGFKLKAKYDYVRVIAEPTVKIPNGFPGAGEPAWLFVSEIQVR